MKNKKIIDAWNKMKPSVEIKKQIFNEIMQRYNIRRPVYKQPVKIIAAAAAVVIVVGGVGLINIQRTQRSGRISGEKNLKEVIPNKVRV
ncbi:MAG: hypothetical protein FWD71_21120 [Oscillospiraceae bacterium]|nr:hypothetical protein [Oscillospiraceae bacterium]